MRAFARGFIVGAATAWAVGAALTQHPVSRVAGPPVDRPGRWIDAGRCLLEHPAGTEGGDWRSETVTCQSETLTPELWARFKRNPGQISGTRYLGEPAVTTVTFHQHWLSDVRDRGPVQ